MINKKKIGILVVLLGSLLTGCASITPQVPVDQTFWQNHNQKVGVAVAKAPVPTHHMTGQQGLLDVAINKENAKDLIAHLEQQEPPTLDATAAHFVEQLKEHNIDAVAIEEPLDLQSLPESGTSNGGGKYFASRDFSAVAEKHNVGRVLILSVSRVGTTRSYYGFIPTSAPQGTCSVVGRLIDGKTNQLLWNTTQTIYIEADGEWDTPPDYAVLTKAMHKAVQDATAELDANFFGSAAKVAQK